MIFLKVVDICTLIKFRE